MSESRTPPSQSGPGRSSSFDEERGPAHTAESLTQAGQLAERSGHRALAREHYEAALHRLTGDGAASRAAALIRWTARTYMTDGDHEAALDCATAALAIAEACGDQASAGHAINVTAAIHWKQGDLDAAEPLFLKARATALMSGERGLAAMTSHNLGVLASIRGDLPEALHHYTVGLELYRALALPTDICAALNNLGRLHTDLGQWNEAEAAYAEAVEVSESIGNRSARIGLEVNRAEMWLVRKDRERAAEAVGRALSLSEQTGDAAWLGQTAKLQGILERDADPVTADGHFARAVELAEGSQDTLLLAETLRERADLHRGQGRNREALQSLNRSHGLFAQLRARRELANVDQSMGRLESDFLEFVKRWGESIEEKDRYTQGHCVRVADLACAVAVATGIDEQSLFWFRIGALLHDVGKLVVPSEVLNKPGKLTDDEWTLMRSHPTAGVEMLADIDFPWDVRPIIESHHERWDGKGYPHRLAGEAIPLSARILCVADVYDALTSIRSYKRALTHDEAMEIMRRDIGTAFDPTVFALFETTVAESQELASQERMVDPAPASVTGPRLVQVESDTDALTGLPLWPSLERIVAQVLDDRRMTGGTASLVTVEIDLDLSCAADPAEADRAASMVADQLRKQTRATDFVARTGHCRFVALLRDASFAEATLVVSRVRTALTPRRERPGDGAATSGICITAVTAPTHGQTADQLFAATDAALFRQRTSRSPMRVLA